MIPTAEGDLRETFDLPLMMEADDPPAPKARQTADAVALFQDKGPPARRPAGAEARARSRRCPKCGGVVPQGMSLCSFCGLDLDTGQRVDLDEVYDSAPPPAPALVLPIGVGVVGGVSFMGSLILAIVSFVLWFRGQHGYEFLGLVCLFGIFAAVQFLRGKSFKPLVIALTLGALIDIVGLIALPVYKANADAPPPASFNIDPAEDDARPHLPSYVERLDFQSITWGIALILIYVIVVLYSTSPPVRRYFERR